jgi:hypothetical protein
VANAAIAAQIHEPLDAHGHLAPQVAFDRELLDLFAQPVHVGVGEILDLGRFLDAGSDADRLRPRTADAVNRGERDFRVLMIGNVDACNTGHSGYLPLPVGMVISLAAACAAGRCR